MIVLLFAVGLLLAVVFVAYQFALVEEAANGVSDEPWLAWDGEDPVELAETPNVPTRRAWVIRPAAWERTGA